MRGRIDTAQGTERGSCTAEVGAEGSRVCTVAGRTPPWGVMHPSGDGVR